MDPPNHPQTGPSASRLQSTRHVAAVAELGSFKDLTALTPERVHGTLKRFFPAKNDDFLGDYVETPAELQVFRITTEEQLVDLLKEDQRKSWKGQAS